MVTFGEDVVRRSAPFNAVLKRDGAWWFGWVQEVPGVNGQERTREALIDSLQIGLREMLTLNRRDAIAAAGTDYTETAISP